MSGRASSSTFLPVLHHAESLNNGGTPRLQIVCNRVHLDPWRATSQNSYAYESAAVWQLTAKTTPKGETMKFHPILILAIAIAAISVGAIPAAANHLASANVTDDCTGYQITLTASGLALGRQYTIKWTINGLPQVIHDQLTFTAHSATFTTTVSKKWSDYGIILNGNYTLSGTATLVFHNTVTIHFNPSQLSCPLQCTTQSGIASNFNGTGISGGDYIWFNANFTASGVPSTGATLFFENSTIQFSANGTNYNLSVPNAKITFSPSASCTSTSFDGSTNTWITVTPLQGEDEVFLSGLAFPVPAGGLPGGINPVTWAGGFGSDTAGVTVQWKWGAAVYTTFTTNYDTLAVKPGHQTACSYNNSDHAGTPEGTDAVSGRPFKDFVIGGSRGGGGSNWTGSWSGTSSVTACH